MFGVHGVQGGSHAFEDFVGETLYRTEWVVGRNHLFRRGVNENGSLALLVSFHVPLRIFVK